MIGEYVALRRAGAGSLKGLCPFHDEKTPSLTVRPTHGSFHCFENRCAHRGAELCRPASGKTTELVCPYHQWTYDLAGNLTAVPFRRGVQKQGATTLTSALHGLIRDDARTRQEFLGLTRDR